MIKDEICSIIIQYNNIKKYAKDILLEHFKMVNGKLPHNFSIEYMEINLEEIIMYYSSSGLEEYYIDEYICPTCCFWDDNWKEKLLIELKEKNNNEERLKMENNKKEQELLEKLKIKCENE